MKIRPQHATLLAGCSAFVLMAAQPASAAEWELGVGGYVEGYIGFSDFGGVARGSDEFDAVAGSEVFFQPTISLDNGLRIGGYVELEGTGSTGHHGDAYIDQAFVFIDGRFGQIRIGQEPGPRSSFVLGSQDHFDRPPGDPLKGLHPTYLGSYAPFSGSIAGRMTGDDFFRGTLSGPDYSPSGRYNATRITYTTPTFAGFTLSGSFAPEGRGASGDVYADREEMYDVALRYAGEFGAIRVAADAFYGTGSNSRDAAANPEYQGFGVNLGYGGFTIGGSFAETQGSSMTQADGAGYTVEASYTTGPWSFAGQYIHGNNTDNENTGLGPRERFEMIAFGTNYELKKGVTISAFGAYVNFEEDVGDGGFGTPGDNFDGFVIGSGLRLTF